jgi:hypothetical protein
MFKHFLYDYIVSTVGWMCLVRANAYDGTVLPPIHVIINICYVNHIRQGVCKGNWLSDPVLVAFNGQYPAPFCTTF